MLGSQGGDSLSGMGMGMGQPQQQQQQQLASANGGFASHPQMAVNRRQKKNRDKFKLTFLVRDLSLYNLIHILFCTTL